MLLLWLAAAATGTEPDAAADAAVVCPVFRYHPGVGAAAGQGQGGGVVCEITCTGDRR